MLSLPLPIIVPSFVPASPKPPVIDSAKATVFLFTDGQENVRGKDDVIQEAKKLLTYPLSPVIATISFGSDADESLLMEIASKPNDRQIRHLDISGVLSELPDTNKLYLQGHASDGTITRRKIEAIRNFVETLSVTRT